MLENKHTNNNVCKSLTTIDILLVFALIVSVIACFVLDKKQLIYVIPPSIVLVIIKYLSVTKTKANPIFIIGLLSLIVSNVFAFYGFMEYFKWLTIFNSIYLLCCSLLLKNYLLNSRLKSLFSLSVLLGVLLVGFIIFAIIDVLIVHIPKQLLIFAFISAFFFIIYCILFATIYINDNYNNGTILLASGIFGICQISFTLINELLYYNKVITALIILSQFLSIVLLLYFITNTKTDEATKSFNKYF